MTSDEAMVVLRMLTAPWPYVTVSEDYAEMWYLAALAGCSFEGGKAVAVALVAHSTKPLVPADFNRALVDLRRRHRLCEDERALPSGERIASPETVAFWRAKCRQQLEHATGPLARTLRPIVSVPRADKPYFADRHNPDPVEQWYGDDPQEEA